jgi:4-amino-4-deoxy-L-arabinose transferase-like glycosyltransferase
MAILEHRRGWLILIVLWGVVYFPNLGRRDLRVEEGRRATPARELHQSGDWVCPTLAGDPYLNKPPFFYHIVAATGAICGGHTAWTLRLPSVLAVVGCSLVCLAFAKRDLPRATRMLAALFVLASMTMLEKGTLGEIDPVLCVLVGGACASWWNGETGTPNRRRWIRVGLWLGLAALTKGPEGPAIFYLAVGSYLLLQRRLWDLVRPAHFLGIAIALLPTVVWVGLLLQRGIVTAEGLLTLWTQQLGMDNAAEDLLKPGSRAEALLRHYGDFLINATMMLIPGLFWIVPAVRQREKSDLQRFLCCATVVPFVVFFLYPESRARHVMPIIVPACLLAAIGVGQANPLRFRAGDGLLRWLPTGLAVVFLVFLVGWQRDSLLEGLAAVVLVAAIPFVRWTTATRGEQLAVRACLAALGAGFLMNVIVVPWLADRAITKVAMRDLNLHIPGPEVVLTTRRFPETGDGYYNVQFHLAERLRSVRSLEDLAGHIPCTAVVTPEEFRQFRDAYPGFTAAILGSTTLDHNRGLMVVRFE